MSSPQNLFAIFARSRLAVLGWLTGWWLVIYFAAQIALLALSPRSYGAANRAVLAEQLVRGTAPILPWFCVLVAIISLVLTRIVVVTAQSYGLSQYALQVVIRVLVLELIPLGAALFVALRSTLLSSHELATLRASGQLQRLSEQGVDPFCREALPRVLAGVFANVTLAALSCVLASVLAYLAVYGWRLSALPTYTHLFGQVFNPAVTLIFVLKTAFFGLAVAVLPMASAMYDQVGKPLVQGFELRVLARVFAAIVLIEALSLVGNYY